MRFGKGGRPKYGNTKVVFQGAAFDSILERDRWLFLLDMEREGKITKLRRQEHIALKGPDGSTVCVVIPDFSYYHLAAGRVVREDTKGVLTDVFRVKAKLYRANFADDIHIVTKKTLTELPCG
jgi:hypothetical protein